MSFPAIRRATYWTVGWLGRGIALSLAAMGCTPTDSFRDVQIEKDEGHAVVRPGDKSEVAVVFTGSTRGEFEPCGCGGVFEGGFARRSVLVQRMRAVNPNLILLDTGDTTSSGTASQTEFISQAYGLLRYDAIAVGEGDLRGGRDVFEMYARKYQLPFVASNLKFNGPTVVREVIPIKRGGRRMAVISLIPERWLAVLPRDIREQLTYETPDAALARLMPSLRKTYDTIILLSHFCPRGREEFLGTGAGPAKLAGIDLWIDSGGHPWSTVPRALAAATQPAKAARTPKDECFLLDRDPPLFISWQNDRKVGIATLRWQKDKLTVSSCDMIPLARGMDQDKRYLDIYDTYRYVSRQEMIRRLMNPLQPAATQPVGIGYVGSDKCGACHSDAYEFWKTTKHARAFATLKKTDRDADANCWACHTVGYREPSGFDTPVTTPHLVNVGCQDCHQKDLRTHPGSAKPATAPAAAGFRGNLTQSWHCGRCHVPHRSPNFEYRSYLKRISCREAVQKNKEGSR